MKVRPISDKQAKENLSACRKQQNNEPNKYGVTKSEAKIWKCASDKYRKESKDGWYRSWRTDEDIVEDVGICMQSYKSISNCNIFYHLNRKPYSEPEILRCAVERDIKRSSNIEKTDELAYKIKKSEIEFTTKYKHHYVTYDNIQSFFNDYIGVYNKENIARSLWDYLSANAFGLNMTTNSNAQNDYLIAQYSNNLLTCNHEDITYRTLSILGTGLIGLCVGTGIGFIISKFRNKTSIVETSEATNININHDKDNQYHIINQDENVIGCIEDSISLS